MTTGSLASPTSTELPTLSGHRRSQCPPVPAKTLLRRREVLVRAWLRRDAVVMRPAVSERIDQVVDLSCLMGRYDPQDATPRFAEGVAIRPSISTVRRDTSPSPSAAVHEANARNRCIPSTWRRGR